MVRLAGPIMATQLAQTLMAFTDTVMAGAVSPTDLAAVAIAISVWMPLLFLAQGILMALTPTVAFRFGAGTFAEIGPWVWQGLYLALLLLLLIFAAMPLLHLDLAWQINDAEILRLSQGYLHGVTAGVPTILLYLLLRNVFDGINDTKPAMLIGFIGLAANVPLNLMFIHGFGPIPALGGAGCGWATAMVHLLMALLFLRHARHSRRARSMALWVPAVRPSWPAVRELLRLGLPIGSALFFEVSFFALVALLLAPFGAVEVASHQVALNISSVTFMLPLSLAIALTIRVGTNIGAAQPQRAFAAIKAAFMLGALVAIINASVLALGRWQIAALYTDDSQVLARASSLIVLAAIFQLFDMVQVIGAGALRGLHDGRAIFGITFIAFWLIGLPLGWLLARTDYLVPAMASSGFWISFLAGLTAAALLYALRLKQHRKQLMEG